MYCVHCKKDVAVKKETEIKKQTINGVTFETTETLLICPECGESVYDAATYDANIEQADDAYRSAAGIVTKGEISEILKKYDIGKKPLAKLLGWGEATLARYFEGLTPSAKYSGQLKELLDNPYTMQEYFAKNSDQLSDAARKKVWRKIDSYTGIKEQKLHAVVNFFLSQINEEAGASVTQMKLQKLLYYAKAWCLALADTPLFSQEIEAWKYGPVIRDVYAKYKIYGCNSLPKAEEYDKSQFSNCETKILEAVKDAYMCYDALFLANLTHCETPWQEAYSTNENATISDEAIAAYYKQVATQFDIKDAAGISRYVNTLVSC